MPEHVENYEGASIRITTLENGRGLWCWSYAVEGGIYGTLQEGIHATERSAHIEALAYAKAAIDRLVTRSLTW
jgi:hypothetical protein